MPMATLAVLAVTVRWGVAGVRPVAARLWPVRMALAVTVVLVVLAGLRRLSV